MELKPLSAKGWMNQILEALYSETMVAEGSARFSPARQLCSLVLIRSTASIPTIFRLAG